MFFKRTLTENLLTGVVRIHDNGTEIISEVLQYE